MASCQRVVADWKPSKSLADSARCSTLSEQMTSLADTPPPGKR